MDHEKVTCCSRKKHNQLPILSGSRWVVGAGFPPPSPSNFRGGRKPLRWEEVFFNRNLEWEAGGSGGAGRGGLGGGRRGLELPRLPAWILQMQIRTELLPTGKEWGGGAGEVTGLFTIPSPPLQLVDWGLLLNKAEDSPGPHGPEGRASRTSHHAQDCVARTGECRVVV